MRASRWDKTTKAMLTLKPVTFRYKQKSGSGKDAAIRPDCVAG